MRFVKTILIFSLLGFGSSLFGAVQTLTPAEATACRNRAREMMEQGDELIARHVNNAMYMRGDFAPAQMAYSKASEAWRIAADAIDEGDSAAVALRGTAEELDLACGVWRERLEVRERQASIAPQEGSYDQLRHNTGPEGNEALKILTESRQIAADAWGELAEAMLPGANAETLADIKETALKAADEVEWATVVFNATEHRDRFTHPVDVKSAPLTKTIEALKRLDAQRAALQRDEIALAVKMRELDRRRVALEQQAKQAYEAAKKK